MSLAGAAGGLGAWGITILIAALIGSNGTVWLSDFIAAAALGALVGGFTMALSDRTPGEGVRTGSVAKGVGVGVVAGIGAGLLQIPISQSLAAQSPMLSRIFSWMITGALIGLGMGLIWVMVNRARMPYAFTGGLIGGVLGGLVFGGLAVSLPGLFQALGFMLAGAGVCFGIGLAPMLLRFGALLFVSSGDARAQSKLGRPRKEWELEQGNSYILGSASPDPGASSRFDNQLFIPDAGIAARHAIVFWRGGRFYIARHAEVASPAGLARFVLRVRGKSVSSREELRDADDILVGRTALKFASRTVESR